MDAKELRQTALRLLSRREYTRQELSHKLISKAEDPVLLNEVLNTLIDEHLQSDDRFVDSYVRMRVNRGFGPTRIRQELREKGITNEQIQLALNSGDYDWCRVASDTYLKKFDRQKTRDARAHGQRLRFMLYRGFTNEHIKVVLGSV